jgi:hypothetical protein
VLGSQISDSALVVTAAAFLVVAVSALVLVLRRGLQSVKVKGPGIEATLEAVHLEVQQINKAVNNVPLTMPPLVDRVWVIERKQDYQLVALQMIASHVGAELPAIPYEPVPEQPFRPKG